VDAHQNPGKASVSKDSRTVAMEVGIRQGVCNDSPAEETGPENGWRCSVPPIPGRRGRALGSARSRVGRAWCSGE